MSGVLVFVIVVFDVHLRRRERAPDEALFAHGALAHVHERVLHDELGLVSRLPPNGVMVHDRGQQIDAVRPDGIHLLGAQYLAGLLQHIRGQEAFWNGGFRHQLRWGGAQLQEVLPSPCRQLLHDIADHLPSRAGCSHRVQDHTLRDLGEVHFAQSGDARGDAQRRRATDADGHEVHRGLLAQCLAHGGCGPAHQRDVGLYEAALVGVGEVQELPPHPIHHYDGAERGVQPQVPEAAAAQNLVHKAWRCPRALVLLREGQVVLGGLQGCLKVAAPPLPHGREALVRQVAKKASAFAGDDAASQANPLCLLRLDRRYALGLLPLGRGGRG
mmetsp:Transcript_67731/g.195804  ORF Transcript_67731/g.195804 Transcript_67731/m.195804 type:complete len:329 (+) Transcript_67731:487-1473(+)